MLVLDTSVLLNLLGTGRPRLFLGNLPFRAFAPDIVIREVEREPKGSESSDATLAQLISEQLVHVVKPDDEVDMLALALAGAPSPDDLDDGEAYAIACAVTLGARIAIDESKGRRVIAKHWPTTECMYSIEVLEAAVEPGQICARDFADLLFNALRSARMHVPRDRRADVIKAIGKERSRECGSLGVS
jgi:predicted nucleic acid-binding protein